MAPSDEFRIARILHPTDFSQASEVAFAHALKIALAMRSQLDVVHVSEEETDTPQDDFPGVHDALKRWNLTSPDRSKADLGQFGIQIRKKTVFDSDRLHGILHHLDYSTADLVVLATHRRQGLDRWLHKQIASKLTSLTKISTLFVPIGLDGFVDVGDGSLSLRRILVPVAEQPSPQVTVGPIVQLARRLECRRLETTFVHVGERHHAPAVHPPSIDGWSWSVMTREGGTVQELLKAAEETNTQLIVMATEGPHGFLDALRGSTTEQVLSKAQCPVLAVPAT